MDFVTYWGLVILLLILIPIGLIFLSYWIPKRMGHKRLGTIISSTLMIGLVLLILSIVFHDRLFFKSDADKFLSRHGIKLKDDFKILTNEEDALLGTYQKFELEISQSDKLQIIDLIKTSGNFGLGNSNRPQPNSIATVNYEDNAYFIRKVTQTFGQGYSPVIEIVNVDKNKNRLICYKYLP